jgi:hypothetical protein
MIDSGTQSIKMNSLKKFGFRYETNHNTSFKLLISFTGQRITFFNRGLKYQNKFPLILRLS